MRGSRLLERALRMVPPEWRASVRRDLLDEASRRGGIRASTDEGGPPSHDHGRGVRLLWAAWHAFAIGSRLRLYTLG